MLVEPIRKRLANPTVPQFIPMTGPARRAAI